jgi:hypothetical protein
MTASDQMDLSSRNVACAFIASSIGAIMQRFMITDVVLKLDSHNGQWEVPEVGFITDVPSDEIQGKVRAFYMTFMSEVGETIVAQAGHFRADIMAMIGGITTIVLNMYSDTYVDSSIYEVPTILGGLVSPLFGGNSSYTHNCRELGVVTGSMFGGSRNVRPDFESAFGGHQPPNEDDLSTYGFSDASADLGQYISGNFKPRTNF